MTKIHKQGRKVSIVTDPEKLLAIAICLSESPVLKNRMLALEIQRAMEELGQKEKGK